MNPPSRRCSTRRCSRCDPTARAATRPRLFQHDRRLARGAAAAPERRVAGVVLGQRRARAAAPRRWARSSPTSRRAPTGTSSRSTTPSSGRIAMAGSPITVTPPTAVRTFAPDAGRAHRRGARRVAAARARRGARPVAAPQHPLEGVQVVDAGAFLAGPLGPMLLTDLGADVVKVEPPGGEGMRWVEWSFFGCQRGKRGVALDLKSPDARARARRVARRCRHPPPQPAHARGATPRPRRGDGAGGQPRHRLLPHQLVRPAGAAGRLARLRPAVPVVVRLGGRGRGRGQPADVAPLRLHGPPLRDGLADRDPARAVPPRPHRARRSSSPGRCSAAA